MIYLSMFLSFSLFMHVSRILGFLVVVVDFVLCDYIDDLVVVLDDVCCCCVALPSGDLLVFRNYMVVYVCI